MADDKPIDALNVEALKYPLVTLLLGHRPMQNLQSQRDTIPLFFQACTHNQQVYRERVRKEKSYRVEFAVVEQQILR